ncbi:peptide-methionine (S)-S-oxide reductase [Rhizobium sp. PP-WC-2G-219]|uniref:Peptide methionine sulfoxide reductase MsrA n=1 Tax=Ferranicluibacter rubi TaxID=2715133 RepID=A0AA43ZG67_9HYPH|nr:peptide-methionine (S)-S-oxide reductase MsrA [Ferranicluibacter rubi]NHT76511.1 peptide-methionine (S)-S-oxide reductase MsrA [Ferranicluibacter rubi]PYE45033.1 peptide-methionine (S)-S-oxide reductase [Rhizobium sp. PP-F2F-G20b]TCL93800.1 peptide-methionine (S)-S-oxide reductase [Rhizobium sp. PP-WC-2G-219]
MSKTSRSNLRRNLTGGVLGAFALTALIIAVTAVRAGAAEEAVVIPPPSIDETTSAKTEKAVFAGGCFWGVQGVFQHVKGVTNAVSGYSGGAKETASYETVSGGKTGHAEAVEVTYDPSQVSYGQLLQIFFSVAHNPTQLNYQGPDHGTQYRSAIFTLSPEQKKVADAYVAQLDKAKVFPDKVVTEVADLKGFYTAEAYHQDFLTLNPDYPYIVYNDLPKIENLKTVFPKTYRDKPALVSQAKG